MLKIGTDRQQLRQNIPAYLATLLATAYFALWACAPMATMPPQIYNDPARRSQVGVAAVYAEAPTARSARGFSGIAQENGVQGQIWWATQKGAWDLGTLLHAGSFVLPGGGGFARLRLVDDPTMQVGIQLTGGFLWGSVSLPVAIALFEGGWIYTAPSLGVQPGIIRLPLGFSVRLNDWVSAHVEGTVATDETPKDLLSSQKSMDPLTNPDGTPAPPPTFSQKLYFFGGAGLSLHY